MDDSSTRGFHDEGHLRWRSRFKLYKGVHDGQGFTVVDAHAMPISSVETFLRHLGALGYSPNTVKAYAHGLADLFTWLSFRRRDWRTLTVVGVGEWVAWLRLPDPARQGRVGVLLSVQPAVSERTLQRKLAAISAFHGVPGAP